MLTSSSTLLRGIIFIKGVHLLPLGAVVWLLSRNYIEFGGFSRGSLQAGPLPARLKHNLLHLHHGGPG